MFDFENLEVYNKTKQYNLSINKLLMHYDKLDYSIQNQLRRASLSILLNIAEGSGRRTNLEKRNFYSIAKGSVYENVAVLDLLKELKILSGDEYQQYYKLLEELSKMLSAMINNLSNAKT